MTVKEGDGRCILKSGCTIADSTEESTTYEVAIDQLPCPAEPEPEDSDGAERIAASAVLATMAAGFMLF